MKKIVDLTGHLLGCLEILKIKSNKQKPNEEKNNLTIYIFKLVEVERDTLKESNK